jgi:putative flippase GtrA
MSKTRAQLILFAIAGVAGLAVDVGVLYGALALGMDHYSGRVLSFLAAVTASWQINRKVAFRHAPPPASLFRSWGTYLVAMLGGGAINYLVYGLTMAWGPPAWWLPFIAVSMGAVAGMGVNFASAKFFVFKH